MFTAERLQAAIHQLEVGFGARLIRGLLILVTMAGTMVLYDTRAYHNFSSPEAMDAAQVARNVSEGHGYTTEFIRPFSLFLVQRHNRALHPEQILATNAVDFAQIYAPHPDLANAPLYPTVLAGLMKTWTPQWKVETRKPFWSSGGKFRRYMPEFRIAIFNQVLLFAVVALTFFITRKLFDATAAWLAALLTFGSDLLWKFSVSGLSTMLLTVIFLALVWCLVKTEEAGRAEKPEFRRLFLLALLAGLLTGLGMLTRYSFGWLIVPAVIYITIFGGIRRAGLAVAAVLAFALVATPWILRNLSVSGTYFGTAGYAFAEGVEGLPGTRLMQSLNPDIAGASWLWPCARKLFENLRYILQGDLLQLGGGWIGIFFFAGLLLGLRNVAAKRLRYFTLMCLGVFIIVEALGRTQLSYISPEINSENLFALLTPLVSIFGVAFFLTLLDQMKTPSLAARYLVIALVAGLMCRPLIWTVVTPNSPLTYPPYYPPDIQRFSGWMHPDELIMSDIPWAVAWYGDRQCTWTTVNSQYEFFALNDYIKPVHALYLSLNTMDAKLYSECLQGGVDSWAYLGLYAEVANQLPKNFPLQQFPQDTFFSGMFITDRQRW